MRLFRRAFFACMLALVALAFIVLPLVATADNVVEGFFGKGSLKPGQIVSLATQPASTVQVAPANSSNQIFGVVVDKSKAPITLERTGEVVYVATGGDYPVLVSNENGAITRGDYISISSLAGIGVKATPYQPVVLGHADSGFNGTSGVVSTSGKYNIGRINVNLTVMPNPLFKNTLAIPGPLQKIGNSIAGREVPPFRVYMGLLIFIVATALAVILLVVGIRSALVSLGRNPLSRQSILQGMFQVISVALVIFITSLVGVYLILRL